MTPDHEEALEDAAQTLVDAIARGHEPREVFAALTLVLACATRVEGRPPTASAPVAPVMWSVTGRDPLRDAAHGAFREDEPVSSLERRVRELHALVAPLVHARDMRGLAWELAHAWGDVATSLVRPLWELAYA